MIKTLKILFFAVAAMAACVFAGPRALCAGPDAHAGTAIIPVSEIKPDMDATGLTVTRGSVPTEFKVKIIGIMRKANSGGDMILARLIGADVEHTGVAAGMSGSPIYINGRLAGALAWAWQFSKDPICGITPIEDMLSLMKDKPADADRSADAALDLKGMLLAGASSDGKSASSSFSRVAFDFPSIGAGEMMPIATPLTVSGFSDRARDMLKNFIEGQTMSPVAVGGAGSDDEYAKDDSRDNLQPGSVITVPLMFGDMEASVMGTVTWRDGDDILAFGHPMFNLGPMNMPMAGGNVTHVLASEALSMKMGDPGRIIGSVVLDRQFAIRGHMGDVPDMVPMTLAAHNLDGGRNESYKMQIVKYKTTTYGLAGAAIYNGISRVSGDGGEGMVRLKLSVRFKGLAAPVTTEDMYYAADMGYIDALEHIAMLAVNPFKQLEIESIDADVSVERTRRTAMMGTMTVNQGHVYPGDTVTALVELKKFDGRVQSMPLSVKIPEDAPTGMYKLVALGGNGMTLRDTPPDSFDQLLADVNSRAPFNSIILATVYPEKAPAVRGETLSGLPSSMRDTMLAGSFSGVTPVDRTDKLIVPTDMIVTGQAMVMINVEKRK